MLSSGDEELTAKVVKSLKSFNFFIFQRSTYPEVVNLLKSANIVKLVRISGLDGGKGYYILEPDTAVCEHACSSKCPSDNNLKDKCYMECVSNCKSSIIDAIITNLNSVYKNSSKSV